jgi:hypothetical protein
LDDGAEKQRKIPPPKECGVSVMTKPVLGDAIHHKIVAAIAYLKGWPSVADEAVTVPFLDRFGVIDDRAKGWVGKWSSCWEMEYTNGYFLSQGNSNPVPLLLGAIPAREYEEGKSINLVADGLALMLALAWKEGERIMEV